MPNTPKDNEVPRILVTDDDPLTRSLLARSLGLIYDIVECQNGSEAVQLLEGDGPALVVLDYEMPDFNGAEVCEMIRGSPDPRVAQIPIIMLTGHSNAAHEIECLRAGADDFATKPVNMAVLKARIDTHLRLHNLRRQLLDQNTELERWRRRHEEDLEAARLTQQAILPGGTPVLTGWTFATHFHPLMQIGGDIYDWTKNSAGDLLVWISDATGHGASAALLTTLSKLLFRHAAAEAHTPAAVMDYVEREFQGIFKGHTFMTAACLWLSAEHMGKAMFCGAGQPPLLIARNDGRVESIRSGRPPLGLHAAPSEDIVCQLEHNEALLLYTDGLYEMINPRGERFGHEALAASLQPVGSETAPEWLARTVKLATAHAEGLPFPDDIAAFSAVCKGEDR